ncbi:MAG: pirin family protein, partial [Myxococcales bacterium]|nr:pirin family protein [Myxococcales bacterium]
VAGESVASKTAIAVRADVPVPLEAGEAEQELLLLQGRPIREPIVQYGPFVMNTREEIERTFADYERTRFGGWQWRDDAPVFPRDRGRFARHAEGREELGDDARR